MSRDIYDPAYVAALFDRCSARYRWWSAVASLGLITLWRRQCVDRLQGQMTIARLQNGHLKGTALKSPQVVDFMAGTGEVWPHIIGRFPTATITAIDISKAMHDHAIARLHGRRAHQIEHLQADALTSDLPDGCADLVIATFGLKTCDADGQRVLAGQIARMLRAGGSFSLIEASDPKGWALRPLYRLYLHRVLPLIERVFLQGAQDFSMIGTYTAQFGNCDEMAANLRDAGLTATTKSHFFGCATSVAGTKPIAPDAPPP